MKMLILLHPQGFPDTPTICISTRVLSGIKETKTKRALELLKSFILYCKYFGRLKITDGVIFEYFFGQKLIHFKSSESYAYRARCYVL